MKKQFIQKGEVIAFVIGLIISLLTVLLRRDLLDGTVKNLLMVLSDGFFVGGLFLVAATIINSIVRSGFFKPTSVHSSNNDTKNITSSNVNKEESIRNRLPNIKARSLLLRPGLFLVITAILLTILYLSL